MKKRTAIKILGEKCPKNFVGAQFPYRTNKEKTVSNTIVRHLKRKYKLQTEIQSDIIFVKLK